MSFPDENHEKIELLMKEAVHFLDELVQLKPKRVAIFLFERVCDEFAQLVVKGFEYGQENFLFSAGKVVVQRTLSELCFQS